MNSVRVQHSFSHGLLFRSYNIVLKPPKPFTRIEDMIKFILWLILLCISWPLALVALVLYPIVWLLLLPLRLVGITVHAVFALLKSIVMLPARILGGAR